MTELTICMPVYNAQKYLQRSVGSILNQTYRNFVLRIYDDGSTDDSIAVVESFNDPRVEIIKGGVNKGGIVGRTELINSLDTKYCMWCDADDRFDKMNAFQIALNLVEHSGYDMVNFVQIRKVFPNGGTVVQPAYKYQQFVYSGDKLFEGYYPTENQFLFNSKIFTSELLKKSIPEKEILERRFVCDDVFFSAMWWFHARNYLHMSNMPPIYAYYENIGIWGSNKCNDTLERTRNLCEVLYNALLSLHRRMTAIRPLSQKEMHNLVVGMNLFMLPRRMKRIRENQGNEAFEQHLAIVHEYFCKDGEHVVNDNEDFNMKPMVDWINSIMY